MRLTDDLFVIPSKNTYLLYAPLEGVVLEVNGSAVMLLKLIEAKDHSIDWDDIPSALIESRIIVDSAVNSMQIESPLPDASDPFNTTHATLMPTRKCNLRCIYCYANAGELPDASDMDARVGYHVTDFLVENAVRKGERGIGITFHGGGEPLLNWLVVQDVVKHAQDETSRRGLDLTITAGTNGILTNVQLEWIRYNFNHISVSFDGPRDIQNKHRPPKSFDRVMETVGYLDEIGFPYTIRSTISECNVRRMTELIDFIDSVSTCKLVHLEPLFECGRCRTSYARTPPPAEFLSNLIQAYDRAKQYGIGLHYSGATLRPRKRFCSAMSAKLLITPEGFVSACNEVTHPSDPRAEVFIYGCFDPLGGEFMFDQEKLAYLSNRTANNIPYCSDCYAKHSCAGDCPAKVVETSGSIYDPSGNPRCEINRGVLNHLITSAIREVEINGAE